MCAAIFIVLLAAFVVLITRAELVRTRNHTIVLMVIQELVPLMIRICVTLMRCVRMLAVFVTLDSLGMV